MKIICNINEYYHLQELFTDACCWIGSGEGRKKNKQNRGKLVDLEKFKKATGLMKSGFEWEITYD